MTKNVNRRHFMAMTGLATVALMTGGALAAVAPDHEATVRAFFAACNAENLKRSPMTQTYRGVKTDYDKWDEVSDAFDDETLRIMRRRLATLEGFDPAKLSPSLALSVAVYGAALKRSIAADAFRDDHYPIDQYGGVHTDIPSFLINQHRVASVADAEAYVARLRGVPKLIGQVMADMDKKAALGVFAPDWAFPQMIADAKNVVAGAPFENGKPDSPLLDDVKAKFGKLQAESGTALIAAATDALVQDVLPAYRALIKKLEAQQPTLKPGDGVWRLPNGAAYYQERLGYFTTTAMTAAEVHRLGLDNVARIHKAMEGVKAQVGFKGDLKAFFQHVKDNKALHYPNTDAGRDAYLAEANLVVAAMKAKLPLWFGRLPKADLLVKRVEPFREKSAGKAFYQSPAADGSRPGTFYVNLYDMDAQPKYELEALVYHEGVPGHHMQRSIAQELGDVPEIQKYLGFTAYTEGWGLYTEELAKEMGCYQDPYSEFGRLTLELVRACRLVVDTGLHALKWSVEDAVKYQAENTPMDELDNRKAIERYCAMPGQATAYLVGKLKIMALREKARSDLGAKFDIRAFHDTVLGAGALPLDLLEKRIGDWVAATKAA